MLYARMNVSKNIFDAREKSVGLDGMYGTLYAPKSKMKDIVEVDSGAIIPHIEFLVPLWVFYKNDMKPCQFDEYVETVNIK